MLYCSKCGRKLADDARFCDGCGTPTTKQKEDYSVRKTVFEGREHKCIRCGEVLGAFDSVCPACGYEIRGRKNSSAVAEFAAKIENSETERQRIILIKNFPIPNTKEDIFEFMILASSNIDKTEKPDEFNAWYTKFEQCYQKARLSFSNASDVSVFQNIYEETTKKIQKAKRSENSKRLCKFISKNSAVMPQVIIIAGWLLSILVLILLNALDIEGVDTDGYDLFLVIDLVAGAFFVPHLLKSEESLPRMVAAIGLILTIVILIPLSGMKSGGVDSDGFGLIMVVDIIVSVVILVRTHKLSN